MSTNSKSVIHATFVLEETDKLLKNDGEPTTITVARAGDVENERHITTWKAYNPNLQFVPMNVKRLDVFLTLKGCNLTCEGNPLFKFPLVEEEFIRAWNKLLPSVADEIHNKVVVMNPMWNPDNMQAPMHADTEKLHIKISNVFQALEMVENVLQISDRKELFIAKVAKLRKQLTELKEILIIDIEDVEEDLEAVPVHMRTVTCPHCDHWQQVNDSRDNENLEIYEDELEEWEASDGFAFFVVTCDLCGQRYKMQSDNITLDDLADLEDDGEDE